MYVDLQARYMCVCMPSLLYIYGYYVGVMDVGLHRICFFVFLCGGVYYIRVSCTRVWR